MRLLVLLAAVLVVVALLATGCDSRSQLEPGATPATATKSPMLHGPALTDGSHDYAYRPQIAYIDPAGTVWMVNADGSGRVELLAGCTGVGSAKQGDVVTGGLVWSPDGSHVACWRNDFSVLTARADGTERTMSFKAGECEAQPSWAPAGDLIACHVKGNVSVREPGGRERAAIEDGLLGMEQWSPSGRAILLPTPPPPSASRPTAPSIAASAFPGTSARPP